MTEDRLCYQDDDSHWRKKVEAEEAEEEERRKEGRRGAKPQYLDKYPLPFFIMYCFFLRCILGVLSVFGGVARHFECLFGDTSVLCFPYISRTFSVFWRCVLGYFEVLHVFLKCFLCLFRVF